MVWRCSEKLCAKCEFKNDMMDRRLVHRVFQHGGCGGGDGGDEAGGWEVMVDGFG